MTSAPLRPLKKRKRDVTAQTLEEQIEEKRKLLAVELPKRLPELQEQLHAMQILSTRGFSCDQVNEFRDLWEKESLLQQEIDNIKSGRLLQRFEAYVQQVVSSREQAQRLSKQVAEPVAVHAATNKNDCVSDAKRPPQAAAVATFAELIQQRADKKAVNTLFIANRTREPRVFCIREADGHWHDLSLAGEQSVTYPWQAGQQYAYMDAANMRRVSNQCAREPNKNWLVEIAQGPILCVAPANGIPWNYDGETVVRVPAQCLLDENNEMYDAIAVQKMLDCENQEAAAAPHPAAGVGQVSAALARHQLVQPPEAMEQQFVQTAQSVQQTTHIFSPICVSANGARPPIARRMPVPADAAHANPKDSHAIRELNKYIDTLIDWELIAPRAAEKDFCTHCGKALVYAEDEATLSCEECGRSNSYLDTTSNSVAFNSKVNIPSCPCVRNTHFDAILAHFEPETYVDIPEWLYDVIRRQAFMQGIVGYISMLKTRDILKKRQLPQFYGNIVQVFCHLNNQQRPILTEQQKNTLRLMFNKIREPFDKHKKKRKNFLSYHMVFEKLCQLLGYTDFIGYFDLLKSGKKLRVQEQIWQNICHDLGWPFHSSYQ